MVNEAIQIVEEAAPFLEAEAAAFAIVGAVHIHDKLTGKHVLKTSLKTAAILTGAEGHTWKHPIKLCKAVWHGTEHSLPFIPRAVIAPGVFVPIIGPVDEASAVIATAVVAAVPSYRNKIKSAWSMAKEMVHV